MIREKYRIMDQSSVVDREVCRLSPTRQGPDLTSTLRGCDLGRRLRHRRDLRGVRLTGTTVEYYPYSTKVKKYFKKMFVSIFPSIQLWASLFIAIFCRKLSSFYPFAFVATGTFEMLLIHLLVPATVNFF